jgi:hypothetical protein
MGSKIKPLRADLIVRLRTSLYRRETLLNGIPIEKTSVPNPDMTQDTETGQKTIQILQGGIKGEGVGSNLL